MQSDNSKPTYSPNQLGENNHNQAHQAKAKKPVKPTGDGIEQKLMDLTVKRKALDIVHAVVLLSGLFLGYLEVC